MRLGLRFPLSGPHLTDRSGGICPQLVPAGTDPRRRVCCFITRDGSLTRSQKSRSQEALGHHKEKITRSSPGEGPSTATLAVFGADHPLLPASCALWLLTLSPDAQTSLQKCLRVGGGGWGGERGQNYRQFEKHCL